MNYRCIGRIVLLPVLALLSAGCTDETHFELSDHLNLEWTAEPVHFPFEAAAGACNIDSVRLFDPDGNPVPVQLSDIEFWPARRGGRSPFVRNATVSFIVDLAPLARDTYTLSYGSKPAEAPDLASDLVIAVGDDAAELRNSHTGIRLALGSETFTEPVPPAQVPAPVRSLRMSDGTVFGASRLFGDRGVAAWSSELIDNGPVFARVRFRYTYADGAVLTLDVRLAARQREIEWFTEVNQEAAGSGFDLILSEGLPPLLLHLQREHGRNRPVFEAAGTSIRDWAVKRLADYDDARITSLTPWADWWNNWTQTTLRLQPDGFERELHVERRNAAVWVEHETTGYRLNHKLVPLRKGEDGEIYLRFNNMAGHREWVTRDSEPTEDVGWYGAQVIPERPRLDVIKDYVLEWPEDPGNPHPRLYMSADDLDKAVERGPINPEQPRTIRPHQQVAPLGSNPTHFFAAMLDAYLASGRCEELAAEAELADGLGRALALLGRFDKMRYVPTLLPLYDVIVNSDLVTPRQRRVFRAQMAYLGYLMADPATWDVERNYRSFNFNMTVMYLLNQGLIGCLLTDHPESPQWTGQAVKNLRQWLAERVGPEGEFPESSSYTHASVNSMIAFAVAAQKAGLHDFFEEGPFKRLGEFIARQYTPKDPFRRDWRVIPPVGRHTAGHPGGSIPGIFARATADSDPGFSKTMQWTWNEMGNSIAINVPNLGGLEQWYMDSMLPAAPPDWASQFFPDLGVVLRQGVGTEDEHYINIVTNPRGNPDIWAPELGGFARWFFRGRPIGGAFAGGERERHELLRSRVMPARSWDPATDTDPRPFGTTGEATVNAFTAMPRLDLIDVHYALARRDNRDWFPDNMPAWPAIETPGSLPMSWRRQLLYLKDTTPAGPAYLVIRDTVSGNQPSVWQFWTLSDKLGRPEQAADRETFLADRPGPEPRPARPLEGDRFTAAGQLDVDIDYFVAAPDDTPRHTVRFGDRFHAYVAGWFEEYQDALHLQMPGDGHYYVVVFPRLRDEAAPAFRTLADGAVIEISGDFGTDYAFLSEATARADAGDAVFYGTAAAVMNRGDGVVLALGAPGSIEWRTMRVACEDSAVSVLLGNRRAAVYLPEGHAGASIILTIPGRWAVREGSATLEHVDDGTTLLRVPAGEHSTVIEAP